MRYDTVRVGCCLHSKYWKRKEGLVCMVWTFTSLDDMNFLHLNVAHSIFTSNLIKKIKPFLRNAFTESLPWPVKFVTLILFISLIIITLIRFMRLNDILTLSSWHLLVRLSQLLVAQLTIFREINEVSHTHLTTTEYCISIKYTVAKILYEIYIQ